MKEMQHISAKELWSTCRRYTNRRYRSQHWKSWFCFSTVLWDVQYSTGQDPEQSISLGLFWARDWTTWSPATPPSADCSDPVTSVTFRQDCRLLFVLAQTPRQGKTQACSLEVAKPHHSFVILPTLCAVSALLHTGKALWPYYKYKNGLLWIWSCSGQTWLQPVIPFLLKMSFHMFPPKKERCGMCVWFPPVANIPGEAEVIFQTQDFQTPE